METEKAHVTNGAPCWCNPRIVKVAAKKNAQHGGAYTPVSLNRINIYATGSIYGGD